MTLKEKIAYIYHCLKEYGHDARLFVGNSIIDGYAKKQQRFLAMITLRAHVVEKGLAMPQMRYNFGEENIRTLISLLMEYAELKYDTGKDMYVNAVEAILEYENVHRIHDCQLPADIQDGINQLKALYPDITPSVQPVLTHEEMYYHGDFAYIARHRHSVRNFNGPVNEHDLQSALELAGTAPSACNRQPCRIHVISKGTLFDEITKIQSGNRGFGHLADKLLIVTSDVSGYNSLYERNCPFVDGGIFVMNLLYSLQYYGIAACTLNCCLDAERDKKLRSLLRTNDAFVAVIAIGNCPDNVKVVKSERITSEEYIINH